MASTYFSVRLSMLRQLGGRLTEIGSTVQSGSTFTQVSGADSYHEITSALGGFKDDWDNATKRLVDKTGAWGTKTQTAGQFMTEHDQGLAASYRGEQV